MEQRLVAAGVDPAGGGLLAHAVVGGPATVRAGLEAFFARHAPDEVMVTSQIYDHALRVRSYALLADVRDALSKAA